MWAVERFAEPRSPIPRTRASGLSYARSLSPNDFLHHVVELYWACLSRLVRLVFDADA